MARAAGVGLRNHPTNGNILHCPTSSMHGVGHEKWSGDASRPQGRDVTNFPTDPVHPPHTLTLNPVAS